MFAAENKKQREKTSMIRSQSISGSSFLSAADENEPNGNFRRDFEQIDAVLYGESKSKRTSIKQIYDEWSKKPHFRIRGSILPFFSRPNSVQHKILSTVERHDDFDRDENLSGQSSINSTEGSEETNDSELDETETIRSAADSFDTDDDFDGEIFSVQREQTAAQCLKDKIARNFSRILLKNFLEQETSLLLKYFRSIVQNQPTETRRKSRPSSVPARPFSRNRLSLSTTPSAFFSSNTNISFQNRSTHSPHRELSEILHVKQLSQPQGNSLINGQISPRKVQLSQTTNSNFSSFERRQINQQNISLTGTALSNPVLTRSSQSLTRQNSTLPHRSATIALPNPLKNETSTRLPTIPSETNLTASRSNLLTVSSTEINVLPLSKVILANKNRSANGAPRLPRQSRSLVGNSFSNRENHHFNTTNGKTPTIPRFQPTLSSKRAVLTSKTSSSSTNSHSMKISTAQIYQMTN